MKTFTHMFAAMVLLLAPVWAQTTFQIVLPDSLEEPTRKVIAKSIIDLVVGAKPGDRIEICDGQKLLSIVTFERPAGGSERAVIRKLRNELGIVAQFLKTAVSTEPGPAGRNAIRHPQVLAMMGASRIAGRDTRCILFGSAFYRDPRDAAFMMGGGLYPSDGHLLAAPTQSPYSCAGKEALLTGVPTYFCYLGESFHNALERAAVRRWWSILVAGMGGVMAHCSASTTSTIEAALRGTTTPAEPSAAIDRSDTRIEMRRAAEPVRAELIARQVLEESAREIPMPAEGFLSIAVVWGSKEGAVDIDAYVKPSPLVGEINFSTKETPEGRLLKDIQQSNPNRAGAWEVVEVQHAALHDTTCWLDLYKNIDGERVDGLVRIRYADRTADVPFSFSGLGDKAAGRSQREGNACWIKIDVLGVLQAQGGRK